jgi:hypothetical protein
VVNRVLPEGVPEPLVELLAGLSVRNPSERLRWGVFVRRAGGGAIALGSTVAARVA